MITLQVSVKILLKNEAGKYLLVRRNPKKYQEVGPKWDIVGGRIEPGTPLLANLDREVDEETKLKITSVPVLIAAQDILRVPGRHVVRLTYMGITSGEPKIDEESLEYGWFTADQMRAMSSEELDIYFKELLDKGLLIP
jgi:ADP-ribose pyrophosphatase YjhB (NUDIX family)